MSSRCLGGKISGYSYIVNCTYCTCGYWKMLNSVLRYNWHKLPNLA